VLCLACAGIGACAGTGANRVPTSMTEESQNQKPLNSPAGQATDVRPIDQRAVAELKKMPAFLASNTRVVLKVRSTWESIQESGIKLQFEADQELVIQRPNQVYSSSMRNDGAHQKLWYDRNTLTHLNVKDNVYAQLLVPETINEMLDQVLDRYDLPTPPMLDFLYSDAETSFLSGITQAVYVSECVQDGKKCHHLAFSKPRVDYQIWIPIAGEPLPVKYSITWTDEPLLPWFTAHFLDWNTEPVIPDGSFAAAVPANAKRTEVSLRADADQDQ